ncbi:FAD assembly factor SdhE [Tepidimonas charontis]|uniref:FAD assembly factor SdhE n=1 Tax=Tepidimonas charontis TaxID=2267262 RepID=A0A554X5D3_9BURK|nr:succinate dehydrogenase assembly factor 2 [Tepidimonas charontis]TSE31049.1 Flavinator of succinate dehydrogenase [Tepidimonas charontis]
MDDAQPLDERELGRLRWRCRRGLLENDLFIERFFTRHGAALTRRQAHALLALMDLSDNDLLDLLLRRREPEGDLATPDVIEVLALLRTPAGPHLSPSPTATHQEPT